MARLSHWPLAVVCLALVSSAGTVQLQTGCAPENTSPTEFKCQGNSHIFPVRVLSLASAQPDGTCPNDTESCPQTVMPLCCGATGKGCARDLDNAGFARLVFSDGCWDRPSCTVTQANQQHYLGVQYLCLTEREVRTFTVNLNLESSASALLYLPKPSSISLLHCLVETPNCTPVPASVLLVKKSHKFESENCTSLRVNGEPWLECSKNAQYQKYNNLTIPFSVWLRADRDNDVEAWAVVYAQNGENLTISCNERESRSQCPSPTTTTPTRPSSHPGIQDPATSTSIDSSISTHSTTDTTGGSMDHHSTFDVTTVVASVVAVVVVVGVVVLSLCLYRRQRSLPGDKNTAKAASSPSGNATQNPSPASPPPPPAPGSVQPVAVGTSESNRDADYDMLGAKRQASVPRDVTYGHLGMGDVTGGDYDHLGGWQKSAPSGDVIANVYSTAGPVVTSQSDDAGNPYDVAGAPRPGVISSPYDSVELGTHVDS